MSNKACSNNHISEGCCPELFHKENETLNLPSYSIQLRWEWIHNFNISITLSLNHMTTLYFPPIPGEPGINGTRGMKGDNGTMGLKGDQGQRGLPGRKGDVGDEGEKGCKGMAGSQGEKGDEGQIGPTGPKGDPGTLSVSGKVASILRLCVLFFMNIFVIRTAYFFVPMLTPQ